MNTFGLDTKFLLFALFTFVCCVVVSFLSSSSIFAIERIVYRSFENLSIDEGKFFWGTFGYSGHSVRHISGVAAHYFFVIITMRVLSSCGSYRITQPRGFWLNCACAITSSNTGKTVEVNEASGSN